MGEMQKRRPQRSASADLRKALCEVYAAGAPIRVLSDRTRLSYGAIHRILSAGGVLRSPGGRRDDSIPTHVVAMVAALPIAPIAKPSTRPHNIPAEGLAVIRALLIRLADLERQILTLQEDDQMSDDGVSHAT